MATQPEPDPQVAPNPPSSPGAPVPAPPAPANTSPASPAAATQVLGGDGVKIPVLP